MSATKKMPPGRARRFIAEQLKAPTANASARLLGQTLVRLNRLNEEQVEKVLAQQEKTSSAFGQTAVKMGLLTTDDLHYALGVQLGFLHETTNPVRIPKALIVARNPYSPSAEEFRMMRTRLYTGSARNKLNLFAITGANDDAGGDYAGLNLAASFAQLGKRVLLVDADLRMPSLARVFGNPGAAGIVEIVTNSASYESAIYPTLICNLEILPAGGGAADSQSILVSSEFRQLLSRAKSEYDIVVVLTAPYGKISDCEFVWSATKHVVIVARRHETRFDNLTRIKALLRQGDTELIGAAITQ